MAETIPIIKSKSLGKLFLILKSLNLKLIRGRLLTMISDRRIIIKYNTHLLIIKSVILINAEGDARINGNDATKRPAAGVGNPLNENCCDSSKLNFAKRHAAAHGIINAGNNNAIETSNPPASLA